MKNVRTVDYNEAVADLGRYDYALLYNLSSIELKKAVDVQTIDDECYEARFFSDSEELHLFRDDDQAIKAVIVSDSDDYIDVKYDLAAKYSGYGKKLIVRRYIEPDEDGQMTVTVTRLTGIE